MSYVDRQDAGRKLAQALKRFRDGDIVVLALPRGGIVLGAEVARTLKVTLDVIGVRKIGHPFHPEYAIGAVVGENTAVYNRNESAAVDKSWLKKAEAEARELIKKRVDLYYHEDFQPIEVNGKTVILVDDGIATGLSMQASVRAMREQGAERIIVAVPVAPADSVETLKTLADEVVVLDNPGMFLGAVGAHYQLFDQVDDEEVKALLKEVNHELQRAVA
ncbi:MAG TPA: phosphoribosyltransferase family protein [Candidatus Saccharimonadales bacterium]|nr:phosphoribosyltransferase family protein [Candidatus Saccharimonadales bacterium]